MDPEGLAKISKHFDLDDENIKFSDIMAFMKENGIKSSLDKNDSKEGETREGETREGETQQEGETGETAENTDSNSGENKETRDETIDL